MCRSCAIEVSRLNLTRPMGYMGRTSVRATVKAEVCGEGKVLFRGWWDVYQQDGCN